PTLESEEAYNVYGAGEPVAPSERLGFVLEGGADAAKDAAFRAGVADLVASLKAATVTVDGAKTATFSEVVDPFAAPAEAGLISPDGTTVQIIATALGERDRVAQLLRPVPAIIDAARAAMPNATIHVVSNTFINRDINDLISHDLDSSLRVTVPLTFLILLLAFGAIVASVVPLVLAITSLAAAFGILGLYSQTVSSVSPNATQL